MPRPAAGYKNTAGTRVSGITTILEGLGWNKRGLNYYWWEQGCKGAQWPKPLEEAAALGTLIHALIEADLRGRPAPEIPPEHKDRADNAMLAFYEWRSGVGLEVTDSEVSLVSEEHQYGGTIDFPVRLRGRRALCELKTSKEVYADHRIQLAAQGRLWNECYPDDPVQGYYLLRVGKEDGGFSYHYWPNLEKEWTVFTHLLAIHRLQKELK